MASIFPYHMLGTLYMNTCMCVCVPSLFFSVWHDYSIYGRVTLQMIYCNLFYSWMIFFTLSVCVLGLCWNLFLCICVYIYVVIYIFPLSSIHTVCVLLIVFVCPYCT